MERYYECTADVQVIESRKLRPVDVRTCVILVVKIKSRIFVFLVDRLRVVSMRFAEH